jgi:hypothetical protein
MQKVDEAEEGAAFTLVFAMMEDGILFLEARQTLRPEQAATAKARINALYFFML